MTAGRKASASGRRKEYSACTTGRWGEGKEVLCLSVGLPLPRKGRRKRLRRRNSPSSLPLLRGGWKEAWKESTSPGKHHLLKAGRLLLPAASKCLPLEGGLRGSLEGYTSTPATSLPEGETMPCCRMPPRRCLGRRMVGRGITASWGRKCLLPTGALPPVCSLCCTGGGGEVCWEAGRAGLPLRRNASPYGSPICCLGGGKRDLCASTCWECTACLSSGLSLATACRGRRGRLRGEHHSCHVAGRRRREGSCLPHYCWKIPATRLWGGMPLRRYLPCIPHWGWEEEEEASLMPQEVIAWEGRRRRSLSVPQESACHILCLHLPH